VVSLLLAGGAKIEATDEVRREMGLREIMSITRPKMAEFHIFLRSALSRSSLPM